MKLGRVRIIIQTPLLLAKPESVVPFDTWADFTKVSVSSYLEGKVPTQWKQAIVILIPKQHPPSIDKLRPVSLTSIIAKFAEGFVTGW